MIDHICVLCGGRLLQSEPDASGNVIVRCACCQASVQGEPTFQLGAKKKRHPLYQRLCYCGAVLETGKHAGWRCVRNEVETPDGLCEVIATPAPPES